MPLSQPPIVGTNRRNGHRGSHDVSLRKRTSTITSGSRRHSRNNAAGINLPKNQNYVNVQQSYHDQSRAGHFRSNGGTYLQRVKSRLRAMRRGTLRRNLRQKPSPSDILRFNECGTNPPTSLTTHETLPFIPGLSSILPQEQSSVTKLAADFLSTGSGYVPDKKPPHVIRLYGENVNSLCLYDDEKRWKISRLSSAATRFQVDGMLMQECGTDFRQLPESKSITTLLGGTDSRVVSANNTTEPSGKSQYGGVAALSFPRLAGFTLSTGKDPTGLGRYAWLYVGTADRKTRIVTAYRPVQPARSKRSNWQIGRFTVWSQHRRYWRKMNESKTPIERFDSDLISQLILWKNAGDEIILFIDANEHVYRGQFAHRLASADLLMTEQFRQSNGFPSPASHYRGSRPITGCFCTQGIDCHNVQVSPHQAGAGDHRYWVMDFDARSVLGSGYPHLVRPRGRRLKCVVQRTRIAYVKKLRRLSDRHNMYSKMSTLLDQTPYLSYDQQHRLQNQWDREHVEHQISAENSCNHFKNGHIEYSPEVNLWIKRRDLYYQLRSINSRRRQGKRAPTSHFLRACVANKIPNPFDLSDADIDARIGVCKTRLHELESVAPMLRTEHLRSCLKNARDRGDRTAMTRIRQIMANERLRKRWKGVQRSTKPRSGGAPTSIKVRSPDGDALYETREEVEEHAARLLTARFKIARDAPVGEGQLFDDLGYLGDTPATQAILNGTYEFPPDMCPHTRLLLEEAHRVFSQKSTEEISNFVSTEDYQYYWSRADEFVQSSYSHVHFGHYKAISHDPYLSSLQAAKLSLAAKTGIPMDRWGSALTVLLEKEFGNIYVDKLRAICLLEADFNWLNKLIFAKRMMDQAYDKGLVPTEQFARRGCQASNGVLCKVLFCDMMRALHETACIASVDLGNCYDAVAHPIASIALQAFRVPIATVVLSLSVLQTMTFFLRTGYGVSRTGYGGTFDDPTYGLGQGNAEASPGFTCVSSLMEGTYIRLGHAATFCGAWSGMLFSIAAIMYVDDRDLLLRSRSREQSLEQFHRQVQSAVTDWGRITLATGGYLKATKCFWYMMAWRWVNGVPRLRKLRDLPNFVMTIPQKNNGISTIPMRDINHSEKTLGVYTCPSGDFTFHIDEKLTEAGLWVERLRRNRCPAADAWLGFRYSLLPKLTYGFAAIAPNIEAMEDKFNKLYRSVLSPLCVNKNIMRFYRMAPRRVMGLGMPHPSIRMLAYKLHLLQSEWAQQSSTGNMLRQSLEVFQMETGLSSCIFSLPYSRYGCLATDGWWKQLWCLADRFDVRILLGKQHTIPLLRQNDRAIMDLLCANDLYSPSEWISINRVRKHKGLHSIADLTLCDGRTIDDSILTEHPSDSKRVFSVEHPTPRDFRLFATFISRLSSGSSVFPFTLGKYLRDPHRPDVWFTSEDLSQVYRILSDSSYQVYHRDTSHRYTRHGARYTRGAIINGQCDRGLRASVVQGDVSSQIIVLCTYPSYIPDRPRQSFAQRVRSSPNKSLWRNFVYDGDGSWIYNGLLRNSLVMMSDGSYNEQVACDVVSCAAAIYCTSTGRSATITWAERSDRHSANNYRAEILGAIALQLIVKIACEGKYISPSMTPSFGCDNNGVVHHGNHPHRPMPAKQGQSDVLRYFKHLVQRAPFKCRMYHVHGHLDRFMTWDEMSPAERLNVECDKLAELALQEAVSSSTFIDRALPDEDIVVTLDNMKITGNLENVILRHWGDKIGREHYDAQGIIPAHLFDKVYWDGIERTLASVPEMFAVWATKQVSGCCGVNHLQHYINHSIVDRCPNCGASPETAAHIISCPDADRVSLFHSSVDKLASWLAHQRTDPALTLTFCEYLHGRGETSMLSICGTRSKFTPLARMVDSLGWRNILEGRIPKLFHNLRTEYIARHRLRKHPGHWCNGLILRLLQITHHQWTYRNGSIHFRGPDGLTRTQQELLVRRCEDLLWTDPMDLLTSDRYLLDINFFALGDGPSSERQVWVSEMEAAMAASSGRPPPVFPTCDPPQLSVPVDTEGSIRFRRRRKRVASQLN